VGQDGVTAAAQFVDDQPRQRLIHVGGNGDAHMPDPTPEQESADTFEQL
jgi:hypothetical protein